VSLADGAALTGEVNLRFNILSSGGQQADDIVLIDTAASDPGNFTINADEILDPSGILTYSVTRNAAGDVVIEDGLNPGIAGLAGNIVLTQSLIGSHAALLGAHRPMGKWQKMTARLKAKSRRFLRVSNLAVTMRALTVPQAAGILLLVVSVGSTQGKQRNLFLPLT